MNFRSFSDMNRTITQNLHKVPSNIDLILGIPRSGLMAANVLAMHLRLPVSDSSSFIEGRLLLRDENLNCQQANVADYNNILVIDDSVRTGRSMDKVKNRLNLAYPDKNFIFATVYMDKNSKEKADLYFEVCPVSRVFEWNIMNHKQISNFCIEMDGVICQSIHSDYFDNREEYVDAIEKAKPRFRFGKKIGYIITKRPKELRSQTELWLKKYDIKYKELIMQDINAKEHNTMNKNISKYKAKYYNKYIYSRIFIESTLDHAYSIAQLSGKLVYYVEESMIIRPRWMGAQNRKVIDFIKKTKNKFTTLTYIK